MNDLEQHLKKQTENIRMTSDEKAAMRFHVQNKMNAGASSGASVVEAPASGIRTVPSPYLWFFAPRSFALLGIALLIVVSTGTAYAAGGALPGAPLYSVKTQILEPIAVALAPSVQAKAEANAKIAAIRVQEAQALAAQGTLTPEVVQQISDNYNEHAQAALALAASVEGEDEGEDSTATNATLATSPSDEKPVVFASDTPQPAVALSIAEPSADTAAGSRPSESATDPDTSSDNANNHDDTPAPDTARALTFSVSLTAHTTSEGTSSPTLSKYAGSVPAAASSSAPTVTTIAQNATSTAYTRSAFSATTTAKTRGFVRQLRESLSAQAQILQDLDAQVRFGKGRKGSE